MKFEVFLPSSLAEWTLDMIEKGDIIDPSEAVLIFMRQAQDLEPHNDLTHELLKRSVEQGMKGPFYDSNEVKERLRKLAENRIEPATWQKIPQDHKACEIS